MTSRNLLSPMAAHKSDAYVGSSCRSSVEGDTRSPEMFRAVLVTTVLLGAASCTSAGDRGEEQGEAPSVAFDEVSWFAERALAAYQGEAYIRARFPNTTRVAVVEGADVQYFLERDEGSRRQTISIRGTANVENIVRDVEYVLAKDGALGIYAHRGFDLDARRVHQDLLPHLSRDYAVQVTGHSMGAAIAALLMIYLHEDGFTLASSMTFGQPKITNRQGVKRYGFLPLLRVVNEEDVIPLLPPTNLVHPVHGTYEHIGPELILEAGKGYAYLPEHDAERKSVGSLWRNLGRERVKDHAMVRYLENITAKRR